MSPGNGSKGQKDKALFRSSNFQPSVNAPSHAHDSRSNTHKSTFAHRAQLTGRSSVSSSPLVQTSWNSSSPSTALATSYLQSPAEWQSNDGKEALRKSSLTNLRESAISYDVDQQNLETQQVQRAVSSLHEVNRENRELLLLGENTRLKHKLNLVLDEAEATIAALINEETGGVKSVKQHYRELLQQQRSVTSHAAADAAFFKALVEGLEADLEEHQLLLRSHIIRDEDIKQLEWQWAQSKRLRESAARKAKQAVIREAHKQEKRLIEVQKEQDEAGHDNPSADASGKKNMNVQGVITFSNFESPNTEASSEAENDEDVEAEESKEVATKSNAQRSMTRVVAASAKTKVVEDESTPTQTMPQSASMRLQSEKMLSEIKRLQEEISSLRVSVKDAEAAAASKANDASAALMLLNNLTHAHEAAGIRLSLEAGAEGDSERTRLNSIRERDLLRSIRASQPVRLFGRNGMHPAYRSVPYQQRLAQIQRDKATLQALQVQAEIVAEEKQKEKSLEGAAAAAAPSNKSKSSQVHLLPKGFDLSATPTRDLRASIGQAADEDPRATTQLPRPQTQPLQYMYGTSQTKEDSDENEDSEQVLGGGLEELRRARWRTAQRQVEGLWHQKGITFPTNAGRAGTDDEPEVMIQASLSAADVPVSLASMLMQLSHMVVADLWALRNASETSAARLQSAVSDCVRLQQEVDLLHAETARLKGQLQEANYATQAAITEKRHLEGILREEQQEALMAQTRLETAIKAQADDFAAVSAQLEEAESTSAADSEALEEAHSRERELSEKVQNLEQQSKELFELREKKQHWETSHAAILATLHPCQEQLLSTTLQLDQQKLELQLATTKMQSLEGMLQQKVDEYSQLMQKFVSYEEQRKREALAKDTQFEEAREEMQRKLAVLKAEKDGNRAAHAKEMSRLEEAALEDKKQAVAAARADAAANAKNAVRSAAQAAEEAEKEHTRTLDKLSAKYKDQTRRVGELEDRIQELQRALKDSSARAETAEEMNEHLEFEIAEQKQHLNHAQDSLDHALKEAAKVQTNCAEVSADLLRARADLSKSATQLEKAHTLLEKSQEEVKRLSSSAEVAQLQQQLEKLRIKAQEDRTTIINSKAAADTAMKNASIAEQSFNSFTSKVDSQKQQITSLDLRVAQLTTEAKSLTAAAENARRLQQHAEMQALQLADECKRLSIALQTAQTSLKTSERARLVALAESGTGQNAQQAMVDALATKHDLAVVRTQLLSTRSELQVEAERSAAYMAEAQKLREVLESTQHELRLAIADAAEARKKASIDLESAELKCVQNCSAVTAQAEVQVEKERQQSLLERQRWQIEVEQLKQKIEQVQLETQNAQELSKRECCAAILHEKESYEAKVAEIRRLHEAVLSDTIANAQQKEQELLNERAQKQHHHLQILNEQQLQHEERIIMLQSESLATATALRHDLEQESEARAVDAKCALAAATAAKAKADDAVILCRQQHEQHLSARLHELSLAYSEERAVAEKNQSENAARNLANALQNAAELQSQALSALTAKHMTLQAEAAAAYAERERQQGEALARADARALEAELTLQKEQMRRQQTVLAQIEMQRKTDAQSKEHQAQIAALEQRLQVESSAKVLLEKQLRRQLTELTEKQAQDLKDHQAIVAATASKAIEHEATLHEELSSLRQQLRDSEAKGRGASDGYLIELQRMHRAHAEAQLAIATQAEQDRGRFQEELANVQASAAAAKADLQSHYTQLQADADARVKESEELVQQQVAQARQIQTDTACLLEDLRQSAHNDALSAGLKISALTREVQQLQSANQALQQELDQNKKDHTRRETGLRNSLDSSRGQIQEHAQELATVRASYASTRARLFATQAALQATQKERATAEMERNRIQTHVGNLQDLLSSHLSHEQELVRQKARLQGHVQALQGDLTRAGEKTQASPISSSSPASNARPRWGRGGPVDRVESASPTPASARLASPSPKTSKSPKVEALHRSRVSTSASHVANRVQSSLEIITELDSPLAADYPVEVALEEANERIQQLTEELDKLRLQPRIRDESEFQGILRAQSEVQAQVLAQTRAHVKSLEEDLAAAEAEACRLTELLDSTRGELTEANKQLRMLREREVVVLS